MNKTIMVVMAHPDDEVLGCGGTIKKMAQAGYKIHTVFLSDGVSSRAMDEEQLLNTINERKDSAKRASEKINVLSTCFFDYPDNQLDTVPMLEIVKSIEKQIEIYCPSLIFTHHFGDVNIDHRIVHEAVTVATRPQNLNPVKTVLACEIPSSTEWQYAGNNSFMPNWFVDISDTLNDKCMALKEYEVEMREFPHPRSLQAINSLAHWRGASIGVNAAEAFVLCRHQL